MKNRSIDFEHIVEKVLETYGFHIYERPELPRHFDLKASYGGMNWIIEVKYYRYTTNIFNQLRRVSLVLSDFARESPDRLLIIVSCYVSPDIRQLIQDEFGVTIFDSVDLLNMASEDQETVRKIQELLEDPVSTFERREVKVDSGRRPRAAVHPRAPRDTKGSDLCAELRSLKPGKRYWRDYEILGEKIAKYLFSEALDGWRAQKTSSDGLNRPDLVCRIRDVGGIWSILSKDISNRYLVFEFKNGATHIDQGHILTTEKYLMENGLRKVAIIFCRKNVKASALVSMQGAMRESGKLILCWNDDFLCKLLHEKEIGGDFEAHIFDIIDEFLLTLNR